ncbi:MAG: hypothetical protein PHU85_20580 [Phycisphaerae bacterium]|nr:hypothetical protein [Phycisphaerae bacterium]
MARLCLVMMAAMKIRAQIEEYRKRFAVSGPVAPTGPDPKVAAQLKELLEVEAKLRAAGQVEKANAVRAEINKLSAVLKTGGSATPVIDRSVDLELAAVAPKDAKVGQPIKLTVYEPDAQSQARVRIKLVTDPVTLDVGR